MLFKKIRFAVLLFVHLTVINKNELAYANFDLSKRCSELFIETSNSNFLNKSNDPLYNKLSIDRIGTLESLISKVDDYLSLNETFNNSEFIEKSKILSESLDEAKLNQPIYVQYNSSDMNIKRLVNEKGYTVEEAHRILKTIPEAKTMFNSDGDMIIKNKFNLLTENGDKVLNRIQIGFDVREIENSTLIFNDLIVALKKNKTLNLSIVINSKETNFLELLLKTVPKNISKRITIVPHDGNVFLWARDGSKSLAIKKEPLVVDWGGILIQTDGIDVKRSDYVKIAETFSDNSNQMFAKSVFRFEGGDIIVGNDNIFVGPRIIQAAMLDFGLNWEQAVQNLSLEYGKKVIPIFTLGLNREPIPVKFHIDLAMTILRSKQTAKEVVFLESPFELFKTLFGKEMSINDTDSDFLKNIRTTLSKRVAEAKKGKPITLGEINLFNYLIDNRFEIHVKNELDSRFINQTLKDYKYEVQTIPGLMVTLNKSKKYLNWTNIVPLSPESLLVPNYSIPKIDNAVYSIFKSHGYDVIPAHSSESTIKIQGGIRCVTNCY